MSTGGEPPRRQVRAAYDEHTVTVYQAYGDPIARAALAAGTFVPPFQRDRMTWIKPSFLWMMYRCGWATKPGQERVLAVRITRAGFEAALRQACLSSFEPQVYADHDSWRAALASSPVRVQWDPERTPDGAALGHRSVQVGLSGVAVTAYVEEWIVGLADLTPDLEGIRAGRLPLPLERPYPLPDDIAVRIGVG